MRAPLDPRPRRRVFALHDPEGSVLGAALLRAEEVVPAASARGLSVEHFRDPAHRLVWQALCDLCEEGVTVDAVTLPATLGGRGVLERVGGVRVLHILATEAACMPCNAGYYVAMLLDAVSQRRAAVQGRVRPRRLLRQWRREVARGDFGQHASDGATWQRDTLWLAAGAEANAEDALRVGQTAAARAWCERAAAGVLQAASRRARGRVA